MNWKTIVRILIVITVCMLFLSLLMQCLGRYKFPHVLPEWDLDTMWSYLTDSTLLIPLRNSLFLAFVVTGLSLIIGFFPAKYLSSMDFKGKTLVKILIILPALTPAIAVVFGMMEPFIKLGIYKTLLGTILGQLTFTLPYMIMSLMAVFKNYDYQLEDQSATLGADSFSTFLNVTLPAMKSGIAVGCMYTFIVSWSMYMFLSLYAPKGFTTLVTYLFPLFSSEAVPQQIVAILAVVFTLPSIIILWISYKMGGMDKNRGVGQ